MTFTTFPKATKNEGNELPAGLYRVRLKAVESEMRPRFDDPSQEEQRIKWVLEIEDVVNGDDDADTVIGSEHWHWTSATMGAKASMRNHLEAFLGRQIDWDEEIQVAEVIGKRALATVDYPVRPNGQKSERRKIVSMTPYRKRGQTPAAPATDEPTPGEDPNELPF